ncbi:hypothetical protein EVC62_11740 [Salinicola endophyticus]|uniref:Uncharacterized protein n=1 Tax=Salinicola endophyticus TaxID=1949083 RepID=A0ABY8FH36_9GAMM|nr:hypothetical protein [Salinicola endophyticus]WFF42121.1 hypothetical protein EVC62_11740 [Salinicola endophyticus]
MTKVSAVLLPPHHEYTGNLLWDASDVIGRETEIGESINQLRGLGYWASAFPEGDGVTFTEDSGRKDTDELARDVKSSFDWLNISVDLSKMNQEAPKRSPIATLGFEDPIKLEKSEVALTQLEGAIDLFLNGKRLSSITLAAAADGVFAGLLKQKEKKSAAEETWSSIEKARENTGLNIAGDRTRKDAFNEWNWHQNRLKHHDQRDDEWIEMNVFDHAYYAIKRALADAEKLGLVPQNHFLFEKWLFENIFT